MGYVKIDSEILTDIADAIRKKSGNLGETRTETTVVTSTENRPVTKILKSGNVVDATHIHSAYCYWDHVTGDIFGDYSEREQKQLEINEASITFNAVQIPGAKKVEIKLRYQTNGCDELAVLSGVKGEVQERKFEPTDTKLYEETIIFENTNIANIYFSRVQMGGLEPSRAGLLGYYAEVTAYDANGNLLTTPVEVSTEVSEEVPNTYTPEQMAPAILKLKPAPHVAFITLSGMQTAFFNEPFTTSGLVVTAHLSNSTEVEVTNWTCSIPDNTQLELGNHTVTITYTDESGISASQSYEINVYNLNLVSWATGSEEDIISMIAAADAGRINLNDYWYVGDERVIKFRENPITKDDNDLLAVLGFEDYFNYDRTLVLADSNPTNYKLVNDTIARTVPNFIVQFKECSLLPGCFSEYLDTSFIEGYEYTSLASLLDDVWYHNLPDWLQTIIKPVQVKCGKPTKPPRYDYRGRNLVPLKIFLPSMTEVDPVHGYGDEELDVGEWEYYIFNSDATFKHSPVGTTPLNWVTRTGIYYGGKVVFQVVTGRDGQVQVAPNTTTYHMSPAFCI